MKRVLIVFIVLILSALSYSCSETKTDIRFLTQHNWTYYSDCTETIHFGEDSLFSYSCACDLPVENYDLYDKFSLDPDKKIVEFTGEDDSCYAKIKYHDENYLCLVFEDLGLRVFTSENIWDNDYVMKDLEKYASQAWMYLHVLEYDRNKLKVSPYNYDRDAHGAFEEYISTFETSKNVEFYSVETVVDENGTNTEHYKLSQEDVSYIGEYYTVAFLHFNDEAEIEYVVFYGRIENY